MSYYAVYDERLLELLFSCIGLTFMLFVTS